MFSSIVKFNIRKKYYSNEILIFSPYYFHCFIETYGLIKNIHYTSNPISHSIPFVFVVLLISSAINMKLIPAVELPLQKTF